MHLKKLLSCRGFLLFVIALALSGPTLGAGTLSRLDAASLKQKVAGIAAFGESPANRPNRTTLTENEVNAYLAYEAREQLPAGLVDPAVSIIGGGRVTARATVDLDAVRKQRNSRSLLDPMSYATGRLPVTAGGVLKTNSGFGTFELETATLAGVPVPKSLLQEIVAYYSRSPEKPAGIGLDDRFALPARIREIQVETGRAIVIQ
ncbi:MAG: hypothetical protein C5B57_08230 [Blastocatellia bacterium]|nr:MAG: hypothetical protein C5B57_08230 [Blastocatellia bacterium]